MRKVNMHVRKKGFQQNVKLVAQTASNEILETIKLLGDRTGLRAVMCDDRVDPGLRRALKDTIIFSGDAVDSEGFRVTLRCQLMGTMIR